MSAMDRRGFLTALFGVGAAAVCGMALTAATTESAEAAALPLGAARGQADAAAAVASDAEGMVEKAQFIVIGRPRRRRRVVVVRRRRRCWRNRFGRIVCG